MRPNEPHLAELQAPDEGRLSERRAVRESCSLYGQPFDTLYELLWLSRNTKTLKILIMGFELLAKSKIFGYRPWYTPSFSHYGPLSVNFKKGKPSRRPVLSGYTLSDRCRLCNVT